MSKEIAQTVGGKKIAWLLAILAAFAVLATVGSQMRPASAAVSVTGPAAPTKVPNLATVLSGATVTFTGTAVLDTTANAAGSFVKVNLPAGYGAITATVCTPVGDGDTSVSAGAATGQCNIGGTSAAGGNSTVTVTTTVTAASGAITGATVTASNGSVSATGPAVAGYTVTANTSSGANGTFATATNGSVTFTLQAGVTFCSDLNGTVGANRANTGDVVITGAASTGAIPATTTPAPNDQQGTITVGSIVDDATPGVTATASVHLVGQPANVGCAPLTATLTFAQAELRHIADDGSVILLKDIANNVRGSRHTVCTVAANTTTAIAIPLTTLSQINWQSGGGYTLVTDPDPTFTDAQIFTGTGGANGLSGASCFSWVSTESGDQEISVTYTGNDSLAHNVDWDSDSSGNGGSVLVNRALVKEWNKLEDSVLSGGVTGTGAAVTAPATVALTLNPVSGSYTGTLAINDLFRGSHVDRTGTKWGPASLQGVQWYATLTGCGSITATNVTAGVTNTTTTIGTAAAPHTTTLLTAGTVGNTPALTFSVAAGTLAACSPGSNATVVITGKEGQLGSGTGVSVTETVNISFSVAIASKQVLLAWAGQRIILEHDWRIPAGDAALIADTAGRTCAFDNGTTITYIKGSGPGNFLTNLGAIINGSDQASVTISSDTSQVGDAPATPQGACISRVLYESEDPGEVDIEAMGLNASASKVAFVVYYMKLNRVTTGIVGSVSKPTHNSSSVPDYSPGNPWDASKDVTTIDWNVSKDLLVRVRVSGWFTNANPSGRAADTSDPLNVLPADRWVMPDDWALLAGGPADPADGTDATGTAESFRPYYDIMIAPNNAKGLALTTPTGFNVVTGAGAFYVAKVAASTLTIVNSSTTFRVTSLSNLIVGSTFKIGSGTEVYRVTAVDAVNSAITIVDVASVSVPPAGYVLGVAPAVDTAIYLLTGVPFEGPFSLVDIVGLAANLSGGAALSNYLPGSIRDTAWKDGDVDMWDAPMPSTPVSIKIRGTGFIKQALKEDVYYIGTANATGQVYPNPYYITNIPESPYIPAVSAGGGFLWDSWGNDGAGGAGQGVYRFWNPVRIGVNSAGIGDALTVAELTELAAIRVAYGNDTSIARDLVVFTDNHGEAMVTANGDFKTDLTACAANVLGGGRHCAPGDKVGVGTVSATADYPDFRGKHFPVASNAVTANWTWDGYKDVTIEAGEDPQYKYVVFHGLDRDGFCNVTYAAYGQQSLHPVLSGAANDAWTGIAAYPAETVDFLIDSGQGIILNSAKSGSINLLGNRQYATGVQTFSTAVNDPAVTGIKEFGLSSKAASGATDECQAWIRVSNSLLGILNVLVTAHDDEGDITFDRIVDLQNSTTYTLNFRWSLVTWDGADNIPVMDALKGTGGNAGGSDVSGDVTAVYGWEAASQNWLGFFPEGVSVPGANDLVALKNGSAYWVAIKGPGSVTWKVTTNVGQ